MAKDSKIKTKVVGVSYNNDDGSSRQALIKQHVRRGDQVHFLYKPISQDPNAVQVLARERKGCLSFGKPKFVQIGYLRSEMAADLHEDVQANKVTGRVMQVTGGSRDKKTVGVNIELTIKK